MPFPRSIVDLCIVFPDLKNPKTQREISHLIDIWKEKSWINQDLKQKNIGLLDGEFFQLRLDYPDKIQLYANHQGGYRVFCPVEHRSIVLEFSKAVSEWRKGGERKMLCPVCHEEHALEEVITRPKAHFSNGAIIIKGVSSVQLSEEAKQDIQEYLGEVGFVYKRVG